MSIKIGASHPNARAPAEIFPHRDDYADQSWKEYTLEELGHAVAFYVKRATHRTKPAKKAKDLYHANNYALMMLAHIDAHVASMGENGPDVRVQKERSLASFVEKFI